MYFKEKKIKGRKYKYAVKSVRLPNGKVVSLEKTYKHQAMKKLSEFFDEKEKEANYKYALNKFGKNHIISEEMLKKVESIRMDYKKLMKKLPKAGNKDLLDRFTANFTYESNAIEGNSLTLKDVAMVMFENISLKDKNLREIYETRNSRKVVEEIFNKRFSINHRDILKMHSMLVKDTDIKAGYKKIPNFVVGRENLKTTPPEKVYEEMNNLIEWYNLSKDKVHPIKLAALFHGKFEQIHPFEDGNGRVGRFLINVILIDADYPPIIIRKSQRISYLNALSEFDSNHKDTIERFILERFRETYKKFFEIYINYI